MKICVVTSSFPTHLGDTLRAPFLLEAITALRAHGHEVHVLTQGPGNRSDFEFPVTSFRWWGQKDESAARMLARPVRNSWRILSLLLSGTLALSRAHWSEKFDVVFCCWAVPSGFYARAARLFSLAPPPYTVWCLGSDVNSLKGKRYGRAVLRWILRGAKLRFADGFSISDEVVNISGRPCEFLPTFRTLAPQDRGASPGSVTQLLYLGRHESVKGTDLLIEAFASTIASEFPSIRLLIAGDGPLTPELHHRIESAGLVSRVDFLGRVPDEALPALFAGATAIVIPSRSESIPLVLGEAVQAGKPVIVTPVGDMGRLVREYALGTVAAEASATALAGALREFLNGRIELNRQRGSEFLELLSFEKRVPHLIEALRSLGKDSRR